MPSAAPNIRFPGSPILGPPAACPSRLVETIAGSMGKSVTMVSLRDELISEFKVGCEGMEGSVGDGSRPVDVGDMRPLPLTCSEEGPVEPPLLLVCRCRGISRPLRMLLLETLVDGARSRPFE